MDYSGLKQFVKSAGKNFVLKKPGHLNLYKEFSKYLLFVDIDLSWDASGQIAITWLYSVIERGFYAHCTVTAIIMRYFR